MKKLTVVLLLFCCFEGQSQKLSKKDFVVNLHTTKGELKVILFDDTPLHKENFIKLAKEGFYNETLFHRIIKDFMIQGGDPETKNAPKGTRLGSGGSDMPKIPYEFTSAHVHTKGALAAARSPSPEKVSSGCQFYIVHGRKFSKAQLESAAKRNGMNYSDSQIIAYTESGGYPSLDNNYTVFGQVINGIDVLDDIQSVQTDRANRPLENIAIQVSVKRMSKKKINRLYNYTFDQ